jgi:hypothetical protein
VPGGRQHRPRDEPAIPKPTATATAEFTRAMMGRAEKAGILPKSGAKR